MCVYICNVWGSLYDAQLADVDSVTRIDFDGEAAGQYGIVAILYDIVAQYDDIVWQCYDIYNNVMRRGSTRMARLRI